jgi:hypothetical protein
MEAQASGIQGKFELGKEVSVSVDVRNQTCTIHVSDVYGPSIDLTNAPLGREFTGEFRCAEHEEYLSTRGQIMEGPTLAPRLILKRKTRTRAILDDTGEFRIPNPGEWCKHDNGFAQVGDTDIYPTPRHIYTCREEEYTPYCV